jgi:hypothetical protein
MAAAPPPLYGYEARSGSPWLLPKGPHGASAALQSIGTVAAPLLAGFSFTLVALILTSPEPIRWPGATLVLMTAAGLALVTSVQFASWARQWDVSPAELLNWWPNFKELSDVERQWVFDVQHEHIRRHTRWARATRLAYNAGILCLLAGIAVLLIPGRGQTLISLRGLALLIAILGFFAEAVWVIASTIVGARRQ